MASTTYEATIWLLISTGCLSVVTALLGYTAIAFENRCLLAWVRRLVACAVCSWSCPSTPSSWSSSSCLSQSLA